MLRGNPLLQQMLCFGALLMALAQVLPARAASPLCPGTVCNLNAAATPKPTATPEPTPTVPPTFYSLPPPTGTGTLPPTSTPLPVKPATPTPSAPLPGGDAPQIGNPA